MNRVIGALWSCLPALHTISPRGAKPNHWLPPLPSIKATITGSRLGSHWSTQIQVGSHWWMTPRGEGAVAAGIFV